MFRYYYQSSAGAGISFAQAVDALSPTAYWRLGEDSGSAAVDEQGVQNGVYQASPTLDVSGYTGDGDGGVTFASASSQYVSVADNAAWDNSTSDMSVMFAFNISSWPGSETAIVSRGTGFSPDNWFVSFQSTTNRVSIRFGGTYLHFDTGVTLAGNGWHLCGISIDRDSSTGAKCYIDGVWVANQDPTGESATDFTNADSMSFACRDPDGTPTAFLDGSLDEVGWWNGTALSAQNWADLHAAKDGSGGAVPPVPSDQAATYDAAIMDLSPVAYYTLDDSDTTMRDSSDTDNDGTYYGSPTMEETGPFSGASAVTFDGVAAYGLASYDAALDFGTSTDFSIVFWMKQDTWPGNSWILGRSGGSMWDDWEVRALNADDTLECRIANVAETDYQEVTTPTTYDLDSDSWIMMAVTFDRNGNAQWYYNGSTYGSAIDISGHTHELDKNTPLYVARRSTTGYWGGTLSRIAIFDSLLSSGDISDLWTAAGM
jgi:hypothetical protein